MQLWQILVDTLVLCAFLNSIDVDKTKLETFLRSQFQKYSQ